jgi:hypothetical protein
LAETQTCKQGAAHLEKNREVEAHIGASVPHRVWKQRDEKSGSKDVWANSERVAKQVGWMSDWKQSQRQRD